MLDLDTIDRLELAVLPTPVQFCSNLSEHLGGPRIFVKRDDLTGAGGGGNKVRKLEYVLAEAVASGADSVVSIGVTQSNAMRQLAGTAARLGLECHCAVITDRFGIDSSDYRDGGNFFLTRLFGARVHPCSESDDGAKVIDAIAAGLRSEGKRPFVIPYGISSVTGALGYVRAVREIADQMEAPGAMIHASGSAGTQAGAVVGGAAYLPTTRMIGIDVDAAPERVADDVRNLTRRVAARLELDGGDLDDRVQVVGGFAGPSYGAVTPEALEAITLFARLEGLILDPVYTAKGAAGLIGLIRSGRFDAHESVVFIHTGGWPGLFAYRSEVAESLI
ncbi:MAG: D-cysteine desulfhydrase family protein [Acidimicrobiia bacterium]